MASNQIVKNCRSIFAVGRNYAAHAKELGNAVPTTPVLFIKPVSSFLPYTGTKQIAMIEVPQGVKELHHEVELGVIISRRGRDIPADQALSYISGYCVALDMTAREKQEEAKKAGLPWSVSKGYDTFCAVGDFIPKERIPNPQNIELWLKVDGIEKQRGNTKDMLFTIQSLIAHISTICTLNEGDLILTGTPSGVGPVRPGQVITAGLTGITDITFGVHQRPKAKL